MAFFISHRGNTNGMNPERENSPNYVNKALESNFHVLVDVWLVGKSHLALGYEHPRYSVTLEFLQNEKILCRARSVGTLNMLMDNGVHCFYHENDSASMTSGGLIWTAPGKPVTARCICTMPEWYVPNVTSAAHIVCAGVCSDWIQNIRDERNNMLQEDKLNSQEVSSHPSHESKDVVEESKDVVEESKE